MAPIMRDVEPDRVALHVPILILSVTLDPEYKAVEKVLSKFGADRQDTNFQDELLGIVRWKLNKNGESKEFATGFINGMGNTQSALETYVYLTNLSPKLVFLCGIAGSLKPESVKLGDVVVGESVEWWLLDKVTPEKITNSLVFGDKYIRKNTKPLETTNNRWSKKLAQFCYDNSNSLPTNTIGNFVNRRVAATPKDLESYTNDIHHKKIFSWDFVLSDKDLRDEIHSSTQALAVEMEGGGFQYAISRKKEEIEKNAQLFERGPISSGIIGFNFRGISDLSHNKGSESEDWRELSMYNAAWAVIKFISGIKGADLAQ